MPDPTSAKSSALQELRSRLRLLNPRAGAPARLAYSRLSGGLPRGSLVELTGPGKTEHAARLLAEHPELRTAWIESRFSLFPSALLQRRVSLERLFFVDAGAEAAWALAAVLRSRLFPLVIYQAAYGEERELRRFQLLAERAESTLLLLGDAPAPSSWAIRLSLAANGRERLQTLKGN